MKLLIMQFPPNSRHFISLWTRYSPQHSVLKHPLQLLLVRNIVLTLGELNGREKERFKNSEMSLKGK
jgi:hypothetical protein